MGLAITIAMVLGLMFQDILVLKAKPGILIGLGLHMEEKVVGLLRPKANKKAQQTEYSKLL